MPSAPRGAEEARISLRTRAGRISEISCATKLPMENPSGSTCANSRAVINAIASRAICTTVSGVAPVEPPTPVLSNVITRLADPRASISAGSQLSRFPRKWFSRTSGASPPPLWPVSR
jgi:hypothetical protein